MGEIKTPSVQESMAALQAYALQFEAVINEKTTDPDELAWLAHIATNHLNEQAVEIYLDDLVEVHGSFYVPGVTQAGLPDIDNGVLSAANTFDGRAKGFAFRVDKLEVEGDPSEGREIDGTTLEVPGAITEWSRVEIGHVLDVGTICRETLFGKTFVEQQIYAPVATSQLVRQEDAQKERREAAREALGSEKLAGQIERILVEDSIDELRLDRLDMFFKRLLRSPKYATHAIDCLHYANALIGGSNKAVELLADYVCLPSADNDLLPCITLGTVIEGDYHELCFTRGYKLLPEEQAFELGDTQLGIRLYNVPYGNEYTVALTTIDAVRVFDWAQSNYTPETQLPYNRPLEYGRSHEKESVT